MAARVLFFSLLRDITGKEEIEFPLQGGEPVKVKELLIELFHKYPDLSDWDEKLLIAINCQYAGREDLVRTGDEVAIMPPVQGG